MWFSHRECQREAAQKAVLGKSADSGWMVSNPSLTGLQKDCPSSARPQITDPNCISGRITRPSDRCHGVLWGRQVQKESSRYNPFATRRHHLNPAKYLRPYAAEVASFGRLLSLGARGILRRRAKTTVVICPAMKLPAEVGLNPDLHMESCSRWPELQSCSQACMPQVQFSAEDLNEFAARYEDKKCGSCDAALTRDDWYQSRLAVLGTTTGVPRIPGVARPWSFSIQETSDRICSSCYGAKARIGQDSSPVATG